MTNEERAQRGKKCLLVYEACQEDDPTSSIVDLVADLLHLAHQNSLDTTSIIRCAKMHFDTETNPETARLIAAAPEPLTALEKMVNAVVAGVSITQGHLCFQAAMIAIAKAKGDPC